MLRQQGRLVAGGKSLLRDAADLIDFRSQYGSTAAPPIEARGMAISTPVVTAKFLLLTLPFAFLLARRRGVDLRLAGSGHSFTPLVATDGAIMTLEVQAAYRRYMRRLRRLETAAKRYRCVLKLFVAFQRQP